MKILQIVFVLACISLIGFKLNDKSFISNQSFDIGIENTADVLWIYQAGKIKQSLAPPLFLLDGQKVKEFLSHSI